MLSLPVPCFGELLAGDVPCVNLWGHRESIQDA